MTDKDVMSFFKSDNYSGYNSSKVKWSYVKSHSYEIYEYLLNRFEDLDETNQIREYLERIRTNREYPTCPVCGKRIPFDGRFYPVYCSIKCKKSELGVKIRRDKEKLTIKKKYGEQYENIFQLEFVKDKITKTCIERYGVKRPRMSKVFIEKSKETCLRKYGVEYYNNHKKAEETCLKKYGVKVPYKNKEIQLKGQKTCLEKYGDPFYSNKEKARETFDKRYGKFTNPDGYEKVMNKIKQTSLERYGVDSTNKLQSKIDQIKKSKSNRKSSPSGKSKSEDLLYKLLCKIFKIEDVIRNYRDPRYSDNIGYQYPCDFYIKPIDTFIELQGYWTHGNEPFDETNPKHVKRLEYMKEKSINSNSYKAAINCWTIRDVNKRNIAKTNNLNYIEIFTLDILKICNILNDNLKLNLNKQEILKLCKDIITPQDDSKVEEADFEEVK